MATYIISDLHLSDATPVLFKALECFYNKLILNDKLIIAGDLFDFFVGLDPEDRSQQKLRDLVMAAQKRGIATFFQAGNRDFFLDKKACEYFGMKLLPEYYIVQTKEGPALLLHGDELCSNDRDFQRFRALSKNPILKAIFMLLPLKLRRKIGMKIRRKSQSQDDTRHLNPAKYGLARQAAEICLKRTNSKIMIHGHFHTFGVYKDEFGEGSYRFSLGAWESNFSYVLVDRTRFQIVQKKLEKLF